MNKKRELTKQILLALGAGFVITTVMVLPGSAEMFKPLIQLIKKFKTKRQGFIKSIKAMKRDRLIDFKEDGDISKIVILEKGREKLLKYNLDSLEIKKPKKWDGIWRIVIFDIPENEKIARNALRLKLKELGFHQLQKSVFIFPYPCLNEIQFIEEIFKVGSYINFIEAQKIEGDEWLKQKFNL